MSTKQIIKAWYFGSQSNPNAKPHETLKYGDGSLSCNCRGWTLKVDGQGNRTCRHCRAVQAGLADDEAVKVLDYLKSGDIQAAVPVVEEVKTKGKRVIKWR